MLQIFKKKDEVANPPVGIETLIEPQEEDLFNPPEGYGGNAEATDYPETMADTGNSGKQEAAEESAVDSAEIDGQQSGITEEFVRNAKAYAMGRDIPEGELNDALDMLQSIGEAWTGGKLDLEMFETVLNGIIFHSAMEKARSEGEIAGRNARIEELYLQPEESDGLPHPISSGNATGSGNATSIFDLARSSR